MDRAGDVQRLQRLLGGEHTAWLLDRARRRMELGKPLAGTVTLTDASQDQRRAVERLLGRRAGAGMSLTVSLDEIDAMLRTSGASPDGLDAAVRLLVGDVSDRVAQAAAEAAVWSDVHAPLDALVTRRPELATWRSWLNSTGMLRRVATNPDAAVALVADLVRVLDVLPSAGVALGRLAAATAGDAHALDDARPLATLSLAAARVLRGAPPAGDGSAAERRTAWAAVGVHRDELSSSVLCLGLPGGVATATGRILAVAREAGEPCVLTLRQLGRDRADLGVGDGLVWVCENPIVLASAADELAHRCPPLVCVNGQPSAAVVRLLDLLAIGGAHFTYHGDFDWGGIRIGNGLRERLPWRPWRFDVRAYRAVLACVTGGELAGRPVDATWDADLRPALEHHGVRVDEELVLADLIGDLANGHPADTDGSARPGSSTV
ncbi:TIGR02679 family protein [Frankia sp. Cppng1_Ct_nod]|uniref:TIGR02679 family protein n=1 Tax=Frankia sp. Cppng1_Ct_nod TaxID=2897162 RepID=UPI00104180BF|nr:TIGR02679 family protein [Frankia sp. Cppng1_Ct_nod]